MCRPAGTDAYEGSQTQSCRLWQAGNHRRRPAGAGVSHEVIEDISGSQEIVDASSYVQACRGRRYSRRQKQSRWLWQPGDRRRRQSKAGRLGHKMRSKPDAVKLPLEGREKKAQTFMTRPAEA
jgi:hypothetical protein